jgi:hypothetical protein
MALRQTKPKKSTAYGKRRHAPELGSRSPTYESRLKAAGLDGDTPPKDIDEFRNRVTRRLYIILNRWRGCPQPLCRRYRGCVAPHIVCSNARPPPAEDTEEKWRAVQAKFYQMLTAHLAADGAEDE